MGPTNVYIDNSTEAAGPDMEAALMLAGFLYEYLLSLARPDTEAGTDTSSRSCGGLY